MVSAGKNLMVYLAGDGEFGEVGNVYPIACDKQCSLTANTNFIETTVKDNGYKQTFLPTTVNYEISGDCLVDFTKVMNVVTILKYIDRRQGVLVKMILKEIKDGNVTVHIIWSGSGYFRSLIQNGEVSSAMAYSYDILITGNINIDVITTPDDSGGGTTNMALVDRLEFRTTTAQTSYQNDKLIGATLLYLSVEGLGIFTGEGGDEMTGLNPTTGTATWNFQVENSTRIIIVYKK